MGYPPLQEHQLKSTLMAQMHFTVFIHHYLKLFQCLIKNKLKKFQFKTLVRVHLNVIIFNVQKRKNEEIEEESRKRIKRSRDQQMEDMDLSDSGTLTVNVLIYVGLLIVLFS